MGKLPGNIDLENTLPTCISQLLLHKKTPQGFPGDAVVGNPPASAGDTGSSPGPGRSHMPRSGWARAPRLLSLCSRAREPQLLRPARLEPVLCNKREKKKENTPKMSDLRQQPFNQPILPLSSVSSCPCVWEPFCKPTLPNQCPSIPLSSQLY